MMTNHPRRRIRAVAAAIVEGGRVLIVRRPPGDVGAGAWEFPGGKIEPGESPVQALQREIDEELAIQIQIEMDFGWISHSYETVDVDLNVMLCRRTLGEIVLIEHDALEWVDPLHLVEEKLLAADRPFVGLLRDWMRSNPAGSNP